MIAAAAPAEQSINAGMPQACKGCSQWYDELRKASRQTLDRAELAIKLCKEGLAMQALP